MIGKNISSTTCPVKFTPEAMEEIQNIILRKQIPNDYALRVGVEGSGGCTSAVSFVIGFDKKNANDKEYSWDGITVYIAKKDQLFLFGVEVDFVDNAKERGFVFLQK